MNTMYLQPHSHAAVNLTIVLASPQPCQDHSVVTSHHATQPQGLAPGISSQKQQMYNGFKGEPAGRHFKEKKTKPEHSNKHHNCFLSSEMLASKQLSHANMEMGNKHLGQQEAANRFPLQRKLKTWPHMVMYSAILASACSKIGS